MCVREDSLSSHSTVIMWTDNSFVQQSTAIEASGTASTYVPYINAKDNMRVNSLQPITEIPQNQSNEKFTYGLAANASHVNNFETMRTQQRVAAFQVQRLNVSWRDLNTDDLSKPYDFFFVQDTDGDTQLHISIAMNYVEASLWMISISPHPCLLDIANDDMQTALHLAVLTREPTVVRRLLLAGANPRCQSAGGNTPLHLACVIDDLACAKALTMPLSENERNWLNSGNYKRESLVISCNLELRNYVGKTCLHIAASNGNIELVDQLLRSGANVNTQEGLGGRTALHLAVENGCREVVNFLGREYSQCLDILTYGGATAYQLALETNRQMAEDLARLGASPVLSSYDSDCSISETSSDEDADVFPANQLSALPRVSMNQAAVYA